MNVHQAIELIESSPKFKSFFFDNKDYYLVHCFVMFENEKRGEWQAGYYSRKTDKVVVFTAGEEVTKSPEEEVFKKGGVVEPLDASLVKVSLDEALSKAEGVREEKHSAEKVTKRIVILQTIDGEPTWNITLVTHAFSLINVRVHAGSGEVLHTSSSSVLNLGRRV